MQKNCLSRIRRDDRAVLSTTAFRTKIGRVMKLTALLLTVALLQVQASTSAQTVTLTGKDLTLKEIFSAIKEQTGYMVFGKQKLLESGKPVTITARNMALTEFLDQVMKDQPLTYKITGKSIALSAKPTAGFQPVPLSSSAKDTLIKVTGKVTDEAGQPIPGASVRVKKTGGGALTDAGGNYSLPNVPGDGTLVFSFIGMKTLEMPVSGKTAINVALAEASLGLKEVVAIGYGTVKKGDLTGSVSQISAATLGTQSVTKDPLQVLQGKVPGLDITTGNKPGDVSTPIIRGYNSINASNAPLIVVDGAPFGGRLSDINPSEIERIDVLKDASSTAIYGSRGANGVIIITTRRAKKDGKIQVSYDGYGGISKSFKDYDMMDGETWANFRRAANPTQSDAELFDQVQLDILEQKRFTDWQKLMFDGMGYQTDHNLTLSANKNNVSNMIVLGYRKDQSIIKNMANERLSARVNGDIKLADGISVGYSTMASHSKRDNGTNGVFYWGSVMNPVTRAYDENGEKLYYPSTYAEAYQQTNPLFDIDSDNLENQSFRDRIFFNLFAEWEMIPGLTLRSSLTSDWQFLEDGSYNSPTSGARLLGTNALSYAKATEKSVTFTNILNYKKTVKDHSLNVSLVHDMQQFRYSQIGLTGENVAYYGKWYNVNEAADIFSRNSRYREWALLSFMGRINYTFKDRYLLTLTGRTDGSSRLSGDHKWDYFPSAAVAWRISSEPFMQSIAAISDLKLRISWGNTGNTAIDPYATQGALGKYTYVFGASEEAAIGYLPTELANTDLGWERTQETNIGLDFGFLRNRINGSLDFYRRDTRDLLMQRSLPITSGYDSTWQNVGKTRNQGIELALNAVVIESKDFKWDMGITYAYNKNEILELYNGKVDDPGNKWFIGRPLYVDWLYVFDGIWQLGQEQEAAVYGRKPGDVRVIDKNGSNTYDQADLVIHNRIPKWTGGLSTSFRYRNFDFGAYAYTRQNYGEVIGVLTDEAGSSRHNHLVVDYWTPENPSTTFPRPVNSNSQPLLVQSDYAFRDLSFIRLKNINLGYTFPSGRLQAIKAERLRVYFSVDNPFVWTTHKFEGLDPENTKAYGDHRPLTTFLTGLNVTF